MLRVKSTKKLPTRKELTPYQRGIIVGMTKAKVPVEEIARVMSFPRTTVQNTIAVAKSVPDWDGTSKPRSGRPRKTSSSQDDALRDEALRNPQQSLAEIHSTMLPDVSLRTLQRRLEEVDIHKRRALVKTALTELHAKQRLEWALAHRHWTVEMWGQVVWSDEVIIQRGKGGRRGWVFRSGRRTQERWKQLSDKYGRDVVQVLAPTSSRKISQMMWGYFIGGRLRSFIPLYGDPRSKRGGVSGQVYLEALQKELPQLIAQVRAIGIEDIYFMQDNSGIHRYGPVLEWLKALEDSDLQGVKIHIMEWPPYSPDLNPIEHVWAMLKALFNKLYPDMWKEKGSKERIKRRIEDAALYCWRVLSSSPSYFDRLAQSMVDRVEAVIAANGWYTKY